jgi:hypothetical protein
MISIGIVTAQNSQSIVPVPGFAGYSTGTAIHATALQAGDTGPRLVNADAGFSAAESNTAALGAKANEMQVALHSADADGKNSSGRGAGLQVDIGGGLPEDQQAIALAGQANSTAPPSTGFERHELPGIPNNPGDGPLALNPIAWASLLRGEALANFTDDPCGLGPLTPLGYGLGYAADAQLLDASGSTTGLPPDGRLIAPIVATDNPFPERSAVQSRSITYAVPNGAGKYGLVSETRMTFAPIHIGRFNPLGLPAEIAPGVGTGLVVELLGEWVFRATATGLPGGASLSYGVEDGFGHPVTPGTAVIRLSTSAGLLPWDLTLTLQDVFGDAGLVLPSALQPLLGLALGEDARAIAAPGATPDADSAPTIDSANGTTASGAVDVLRVNLLQNPSPGVTGADVRLGHFEAAVSVPAGGFDCTAPTTTTTSTTTTLPPTTTSTTAGPGPTTTTSTTIAPTTTTTAGPGPTTTTSTTVPPTGTLEICNVGDHSHGQVTGAFTYKFQGKNVRIPVDTCTGPLTVAAQKTTVKQVERDGIRMTDCDTTPAARLVKCEPFETRATTRIPPGGVENETILTFTNVVDDTNVAPIKVCKIAGNGIAVGTQFTFTVGDRTVNVPAGPADQGGYCRLLQNFPLNQQVKITEQAKSGVSVSAISVQPSERKVSSSNANRTVTIKVGRNTTVVSFTNHR